MTYNYLVTVKMAALVQSNIRKSEREEKERELIGVGRGGTRKGRPPII